MLLRRSIPHRNGARGAAEAGRALPACPSSTVSLGGWPSAAVPGRRKTPREVVGSYEATDNLGFEDDSSRVIPFMKMRCCGALQTLCTIANLCLPIVTQ